MLALKLNQSGASFFAEDELLGVGHVTRGELSFRVYREAS